MIISHKYKCIFVSMPKAGTHTFYAVMKEHYNGRHFGGYHNRKMPPKGCDDYYVFSSCRNPYSRLVGAWWSTCVIQERFICGPLKFCEFVPWAIRNAMDYPALRPQTRQVKDCPIKTFIRMECASADFRDLPFYNGKPIALPLVHSFKGNRRPWEEYYTPELYALVNDAYAADFEQFGYERKWQ